jgi:DNA-binding MarR family transcriptional regulator
MTKKSLSKSSNPTELIKDIVHLLEKGRENAFSSLNTILLQTYRKIGKRIVEFEQEGNRKAEYGKELLINLSKALKQIGK